MLVQGATSTTAMRQPEHVQVLFLCVEFLVAVSALVVCCCAYSDDLRTKLWEVGGERGWNSNPRLRIYFYANYKELPEIPLLWSQRYKHDISPSCHFHRTAWYLDSLPAQLRSSRRARYVD